MLFVSDFRRRLAVSRLRFFGSDQWQERRGAKQQGQAAG